MTPWVLDLILSLVTFFSRKQQEDSGRESLLPRIPSNGWSQLWDQACLSPKFIPFMITYAWLCFFCRVSQILSFPLSISFIPAEEKELLVHITHCAWVSPVALPPPTFLFLFCFFKEILLHWVRDCFSLCGGRMWSQECKYKFGFTIFFSFLKSAFTLGRVFF